LCIWPIVTYDLIEGVLLNTVTDIPQKKVSNRYGWYIITLGALTHMFVIAIPQMCMTVLFPEILDSLRLNWAQLGLVWGLLPLGGIIVAVPSGLLGDRFGIKRILIIACVLCGITGALRGVSDSFATLAATTLLFGIVVAIIPINVHKLANIWVPKKHLVLANGILSVGMAIGFTVASIISSTWLSPLLGGWRNVFYLYGAISLAIGILWCFTRNTSQYSSSQEQPALSVPFKQAFSKVIRMKKVWLLGLVLLGQAGCVQSLLGYVPTYLEIHRGWAETSGSGPVFAFHLISTIFTVPMAILSVKIGSRRRILLPALALTAIGTGLLVISNDTSIWALMLIAGISRDGFMAVFITFAVETKGVGVTYAATAIGAIFTLERLGRFASPYIGGYIAEHVNKELPFVFWASLAAMGFVLLLFLKESKKTESPAAV